MLHTCWRLRLFSLTEQSFSEKAELRTTHWKKLFAFKVTLSGREVMGRKRTPGTCSFTIGKVKNPLKNFEATNIKSQKRQAEQRPALHAFHAEAEIVTPTDTVCAPEMESLLTTAAMFCMQATTFLCTRSVPLSNSYYSQHSSPAHWYGERVMSDDWQVSHQQEVSW